jgi:hypothetical protein
MTGGAARGGAPAARLQLRTTQGLLAIWHGVEPGFEPSFDDWYDRQHHLERVGIPGFARARRYVNCGGGPRYFARYDVEDAGVLASAAYLDALNHPTPWTQQLMPRYRGTTRSVFRFAAGAGNAEGAALVTLRLAGGAARGDLPGDDELATLVAAPGVLRAELWEADAAVSTLRTEEKKLRAVADDVVGWALLVDGSDLGRLVDAVARHLLPSLPAAATIDRYRLVFQLRNG